MAPKDIAAVHFPGLNESPSEKEGKFASSSGSILSDDRLNESPSEKEGKWRRTINAQIQTMVASMKVPPKRKGNRIVKDRFRHQSRVPQ